MIGGPPLGNVCSMIDLIIDCFQFLGNLSSLFLAYCMS